MNDGFFSAAFHLSNKTSKGRLNFAADESEVTSMLYSIHNP